MPSNNRLLKQNLPLRPSAICGAVPQGHNISRGTRASLLKRQKPTVEAWMQQNQGKLVKIIDRTCNYRGAIIEWIQSA